MSVILQRTIIKSVFKIPKKLLKSIVIKRSQITVIKISEFFSYNVFFNTFKILFSILKSIVLKLLMWIKPLKYLPKKYTIFTTPTRKFLFAEICRFSICASLFSFLTIFFKFSINININTLLSLKFFSLEKSWIKICKGWFSTRKKFITYPSTSRISISFLRRLKFTLASIFL